jgi:hypothetical protein
VTQLRKMMLEELQRRHYSETTVTSYVKIVAAFAKHFDRPPDQMGPEQIHAYQVYLINERKLNARTVGFNQVDFFRRQVPHVGTRLRIGSHTVCDRLPVHTAGTGLRHSQAAPSQPEQRRIRRRIRANLIADLALVDSHALKRRDPLIGDAFEMVDQLFARISIGGDLLGFDDIPAEVYMRID